MRLPFTIALCCGALHFNSAAADHSSAGRPPLGIDDAPPSATHDFKDPFASDAEKEQPKIQVRDPLEPLNRAFFRFNDKLYFWILRPTARVYKKVAPEDFRVSVGRFFQNLRFPIRGVNNLFQGKFKRAGIESARFVVNSTVGLAGLFDPAQSEWHLQPYPEDFDQTLGFYGLPMGIYFDWPIFGPSSVRGTFAQIGDNFFYVSPWGYLDGVALSLGMRTYEVVNVASLRLGDYEDFKKASFDPYIALRNAYVENRRSLINE